MVLISPGETGGPEAAYCGRLGEGVYRGRSRRVQAVRGGRRSVREGGRQVVPVGDDSPRHIATDQKAPSWFTQPLLDQLIYTTRLVRYQRI